MAGFAEQVGAFRRHVNERERAVINAAVDLTLESMRVGSPITGAPGQPVSGDARLVTLRDTFFRNRIGAHEYLVGTKTFYAPWIEDMMLPGGRKLIQRSAEGGPHSVALTRMGWDKIIEHANNTAGAAPEPVAVST